MKIHQIPLGARFRYQGEEFVKTGPMFGTGKDGQRVFPRYLVLEPLDELPPPEAPAPLSRPQLRRAFDAFCAECAPLVGDTGRATFLRARQRFLDEIG